MNFSEVFLFFFCKIYFDISKILSFNTEHIYILIYMLYNIYFLI